MKLIIENISTKSDVRALEMVLLVLKGGLVSNNGKQHCYHTSFHDGAAVSTFLNEKSERFVVHESTVKS